MKQKAFVDKQSDDRLEEAKLNRLQQKEKNNLRDKRSSNQEEHLQHQLLGNSHFKYEKFTYVEQQLIQHLHTDCLSSGKATLWKKFETLTQGQQRAFLVDLYRLSKDSYDLPQEHDWIKWEKYFNRISDLPYEDEEAFNEIRKAEQPNIDHFYEMKVEEFTSPYREIWVWLNYKGNHQNKVNILRRLEQLPIDRKKWLMQKLLNGTRISAHSFVEQLTIVIHEQTSVDWERILFTLDELEAKTDEDVVNELSQLQSSQSQLKELEEENDEKNSASVPNKDGMDASPLLLLGLLGHNEEEKAKTDHISILVEWCKSAQQLSILLFSKSLDDAKQMVKGIDVLTFVDKILMISTAVKEETRKVKRDQLLKKYGFVSPIVFATYCIEKIAHTLYDQGVVKRQAEYVKLIKLLGFPNDALPTQEQLLTKLYTLYLG